MSDEPDDLMDDPPADVPEPERDGTAGRKTPSTDEAFEITAFAAALLSQLMTKGQAKKALRQRYASYDFSARTLERYISRARKLVEQWSAMPESDVRSQVASLLQGMLRGNMKVYEKLSVVDRIIAIHGIAAPQKVAPTSPDGKSEYGGTLTGDQRGAGIRALVEEFRKQRDGEPSPGGDEPALVDGPAGPTDAGEGQPGG